MNSSLIITLSKSENRIDYIKPLKLRDARDRYTDLLIVSVLAKYLLSHFTMGQSGKEHMPVFITNLSPITPIDFLFISTVALPKPSW